MLLGASTSEKLRVRTSAVASITWKFDYIQVDAGAPPVVQTIDKVNHAGAIVTATDTDIKAGHATNKTRILSGWFKNEHASVSCDVTPFHTDGTNVTLGPKASLLPGEFFMYSGTVWQHLDVNGVPYAQATKLLANKFVASDVTNATTSFADITGLTVPLLSGRKYGFEMCLFHQTNATTTGAQFGVNIGATPTVLDLAGIQEITASVTAATYGSSAMVTAVDTAAVVETTGPGAVNMIAILKGFIQPSADGTLAARSKSEVAVAGGLVIKAGSWLRVWEMD